MPKNTLRVIIDFSPEDFIYMSSLLSTSYERTKEPVTMQPLIIWTDDHVKLSVGKINTEPEPGASIIDPPTCVN